MKTVKIIFGVILVVLLLFVVVIAFKSMPSTTSDELINGDIINDFVDDIINNDDTEDQKVILLKNEDLTDVQSCIYRFDTGANILTARCDGYTDEYIADTPVCLQLRHDSIDDYFKYIFNEHICNQMGLYWHEDDDNQGCYYTIDLVDEDMKPVNFNFVAGLATYSDGMKAFSSQDYYFDTDMYRICIKPDSVIDSKGEIVKYSVNAFLNTQKGLEEIS